jgi:hypothetical protein
MRVGETVNAERSNPAMSIKRSATELRAQNSAVSREERVHLLLGRAQYGTVEKSSSTYSERAQLLSGSTQNQRSWIG